MPVIKFALKYSKFLQISKKKNNNDIGEAQLKLLESSHLAH